MDIGKKDALRRADLAKVHIARKQLCMTDDDYRALLLKITRGRTDSAAGLEPKELAQVLAHMKACGFTPRPKGRPARSGYSRPVVADSPEARKVRSLWLLLHEIGLVRDPSERALGHYCKRVLGVDALQWAGPGLHVMIEGLKSWAMRVLPQRVHELKGSVLVGPSLAAMPLTEDIKQAIRDAHVEYTRTPKQFDACQDMYRALRAAEAYLEAHKGPTRAPMRKLDGEEVCHG